MTWSPFVFLALPPPRADCPSGQWQPLRQTRGTIRSQRPGHQWCALLLPPYLAATTGVPLPRRRCSGLAWRGWHGFAIFSRRQATRFPYHQLSGLSQDTLVAFAQCNCGRLPQVPYISHAKAVLPCLHLALFAPFELNRGRSVSSLSSRLHRHSFIHCTWCCCKAFCSLNKCSTQKPTPFR